MPNVFEFLGFPAAHRAKNKVVQLVKHFEEVPASKRGYPLIGQPKKDGVYGLLVVHKGSIGIFGRTGEQLTSTDAIHCDAEQSYLTDGVYIGEILSKHHCSLEELSGVLNPNRVNALNDNQADIAVNLYIATHDWLTIPEFIAGKSSVPYSTRQDRLRHALDSTPFYDDIIPQVYIYDESSKIKFTETCLASGEEGAVYKQPSEGWVAGHKGYRAMKEVSRVDYDLLCTRVEEGEGKYTGLVANMYFQWKDGTEIKAMPGKGHTHESCRKMFLDPTIAVGKVWRVKGLCGSSKGKVRLPKVEEQRFDKTEGDY